MANPRANPMSVDSRESLPALKFPIENPFSLKVGQVFTGFGIGCGIGIGVGRPIYLGAIPMLQQVMSATRGATDAFSGAGRHVNSSLRKLGVKNIEAGVGCGVGIGHGFGAGIALKPGVVNKIQSSVLQAVTKLISNMGLSPGLSSIQSSVPGSFQSSINALTSSSSIHERSSIGNAEDLVLKPSGNSIHLSKSNLNVHKGSSNNLYELEGTSDRPLGSRTEKVLDSFLKNPIFKSEGDVEFNNLAENLRSENNVLQVLLKHQQTIQLLMEENQKLRRILVEDLEVPSCKFNEIGGSPIKSNYFCSHCFDCRRRKRKERR